GPFSRKKYAWIRHKGRVVKGFGVAARLDGPLTMAGQPATSGPNALAPARRCGSARDRVARGSSASIQVPQDSAPVNTSVHCPLREISTRKLSAQTGVAP